MDVYLRHVEDATGPKLGEIPFTENAIDEAIRMVKAFQVSNDYDDGEFHSAQFVLGGGKAGLEIVVGSGE